MNLIIYEQEMQPDIEKFYTRCFAALGWGYETGGRHSDTINIPNAYQKTGQFWCLYDGAELIGTIAVRTIDFENKTAELKRLYVAPERQGEGLGSLLFDTAVRFSKQSGFHKICADTRKDRLASQHLMRKHGFTEIQQYNNNNFAELFFELVIAVE